MNALGIIDFGIYNVVAGISTMFTFVNASMSSAISRFLSFDLGRSNEISTVSQTFRIAFTTQLFIAIVIFIIAEIIGIPLINIYLNIPSIKLFSANILYQCTLVSMLISIIQVPFNATLIAFERMTAYAYIEIVYVFLMLGIAFVLQLIRADLLIFYGIMLVGVNVVILFCYTRYCSQFGICRTTLLMDKSRAKPILKFSGADFYSSSCMSIQSQGVSIILNRFFGLVANAAVGVAVQIYSALLMFASSITTAIRPRIIKYYASNELDNFNHLIYDGSRLISFFNIIICIPLLFCLRIIFSMWLEKVPEYSVEFAQILLINHSLFSYKTILVTAIQATGKIERFSFYSGTLYLISIAVQLIMAKLGFSIVLIYGFLIIITTIYILLLVISIHKFTNLIIKDMLKYIVLPPVLIVAGIGFTGLAVRQMFPHGISTDLIFAVGALITTVLLSSVFILNTKTRQLLVGYLKKLSHKILYRI